MRTVLTGLVLLCFLTVTSACYGPFNLTRNVYHWNSGIKGSGEVNEKWMKEIVFFGMIVIPVYMFSALLDAFIFNSIQFWTGDNPVKVTQDPDGHIREVHVGGTTILVSWAEDFKSADLVYRQHDHVIKSAKMVESAQGVRLIAGEGETLYIAERNIDGGISIVDGDCRLIDRVSLERLRQASNELARVSS
jgi:hypothetical protein